MKTNAYDLGRLESKIQTIGLKKKIYDIYFF